MKFNLRKVLLVFSVMLMFTFSGELGAQIADNLYWNVETATLDLEDEEDFMARLTSSGVGVGGETIYFSLIPGLGSLDPESEVTNPTGYVQTTYTTGTTSGIDTLVAYWYESESRQDIADTVIITIYPHTPTSLNVAPTDTVVVVTEDVIIVAELFDDYFNHVDATDPAQVSFITSGMGTFGTASVNGDGCVEVVYTTYDRMASDTVRAELISNAFTDYSFIRTIGAAPATMILNAEDSTVVVSETDYDEELWFYLFDAYDNPSTWSDYYAGVRYSVAFTVSGGGGVFEDNDVEVIEGGYGYNYYYSSTDAGVCTVTATSGAAAADVGITQLPDYPDELVITPSSAAIPAGTDITLTARMFDQYDNNCEADDERFDDVVWEEIAGQGNLGTPYIEGHNWKCVFSSHLYDADTARIRAAYGGTEPDDEVVIFSAEPGDLDHFDVSIFEGMDTANVSDGDISQANWVRIEAQDSNNICIYAYTNPDTVTLSLDGSSAGASQIVWYVLDSVPPTGADTIIGTTAFIAPSVFAYGFAVAAICNQVAEDATVTATDTAGHTGTSPGLTWLPIEVFAFNVGLEGGLTFIWPWDDTVNVEVTAIDTFGNITDVGLPLNVLLSANRSNVVFLTGENQLLDTSVGLYPMVVTAFMSGLIITAMDLIPPGKIRGSSYPINVGSGVGESPIVSDISVAFGTGDISYAVARDGEISIKVYNKVGMEVGSLVDGVVSRGYYQASLKALNLSSDVYFVIMQGPGINKKIKATLIQ